MAEHRCLPHEGRTVGTVVQRCAFAWRLVNEANGSGAPSPYCVCALVRRHPLWWPPARDRHQPGPPAVQAILAHLASARAPPPPGPAPLAPAALTEPGGLPRNF